MSHNERHEELAALLALGASLGADGAELERYLAEGCERCEEILAEGRAAATALAAGVPAAEPPAHVRAKILSALGPARVPARPVSSAARSRRITNWRKHWLPSKKPKLRFRFLPAMRPPSAPSARWLAKTMSSFSTNWSTPASLTLRAFPAQNSAFSPTMT